MSGVRHRYDCPLRWGDIDQLNHVNNVKYVDYLQEARGALLHACRTAAGVEHHHDDAYVVRRHEVTFHAPLRFRFQSVAIESWVSEIRTASFTLDHEIFEEQPDGTRAVYLRARTVLAPFVLATEQPRRLDDQERAALAPYAELGDVRSRPVLVDVPRDRASHYPVQVRFSDLDIYRHVNNVRYFEYFQESRIASLGRLRQALTDFPRMASVIARSDVEYVAPIVLRPQSYDSWTVVSRIGTKSITLESEITDGTNRSAQGAVLARSKVVLVFFDAETQRSVTPPAGFHEALADALGDMVVG
ncbi:acyl-CoA thioesterase [Nocardioides nitrophenolicus]|uniref:acyl-CoA thioesterase n=1 Tax=Nocardioides nitrophenolicus TaxID=60489 RepID=UPI001EF8D2BF|nr:thioesterase family protein [Nocardioides nitrophenolicus]MBM7515894.1 acyl-CoA thioester hydrolase [Nocardioides nitrophenolicus]